ncbi:pyrimidine 5 nucleotidase [Fusarium sp. NRRL 52700]|nr:pyrimidine 5 nucleotidase [Fusarium sp. NRRL 52700]
MDQASEKPVLFFDIDNCLYSRNDKVLEHMSKNIDDYFKKHLGLSPDDAERLHKDYSQQYGQAIEGLVRHHQIDALEYNAKVDDAVPLDDLIKPNVQLRQFLEDIDTSKVPFVCKPHKEMFMKAMREAGVSDVSRCYFIDDSHKNCVGAKDAGWTAIHFVEEGLPVPETPASQHQIRHLEELRSLTDDDGFPIEDNDDHEPDVEISFVNVLHPNPPPNWRMGFLFHDICWSLLNFEQKVDLGDLFRLCASTPNGPDMLLNFGHDYGGLASMGYEESIEVLLSDLERPRDVEEMTNPFEIPALRKAITEDGTTSFPAGYPAGYPMRRIIDVEGISLIVAQFDALKLVSLSRDRITTTLDPRDRLLWQPEIPFPELFFDGVLPLDENRSSNVPITTVFFGENDGRYMSQMTAIDAQIFDCRAPLRFPDHGNSSGFFEIDGGRGEEIESFEVQIEEGIILGLRINLNTNRTELLGNSNVPFDWPWTKVTPRGKNIVGMFSQGAEDRWGSLIFHNLGFISTNEEQEQIR